MQLNLSLSEHANGIPFGSILLRPNGLLYATLIIWRYSKSMSGILPTRLRNRHLFISDGVSSALAIIVAFAIRFEDFGWLGQNLRIVSAYLLLAVPL